MKIAISLGFYILFLIANIEGRFLLVNVGNPDVDEDHDDPPKENPVNFEDLDVNDNDGPRKEKPEIGNNDCRIEATVFRHATKILSLHNIDSQIVLIRK